MMPEACQKREGRSLVLVVSEHIDPQEQLPIWRTWFCTPWV